MVDQQKNNKDCGIFAIAFLVALCHQKDPTGLKLESSEVSSMGICGVNYYVVYFRCMYLHTPSRISVKRRKYAGAETHVIILFIRFILFF